MNLKNKTDKELWDMLYAIEGRLRGNEIDDMDNNKYEVQYRYNIYREIRRREKERIEPYKNYVCDKLRREKDNDV